VTEEATTTPPKSKIDLSMAQLGAAALSTVTMSVVGSYLGPKGTIISAVLTAVVSTVAAALYKHGLNTVPAKIKSGRIVPAHKEWHLPKITRPQWVTLAVLAGAIFVVVIGLETVAEAGAGKPIANIVQGKPGHGTTLGGGGSQSSPEPSVSPSQTPGQTGAPVPPVSPSVPSSPLPSRLPRLVTPTPSQSPIPLPLPPQEPLVPSAGPTG
jgi:hypothetical protein